MLPSTPPIGLIGGMGPHAGLDLARAVLAAVRAESDQAYPPFVLVSYSDRIPDRTAWLEGRGTGDPADAIISVTAELGRLGVRVAGIACNTAHAPILFDRVRAGLPDGLELLHMIDEAAAFCREVVPGARRVGVLATLGTYRTGLYEDALRRAGLEPVVPSSETREAGVHRAIYDPAFGIKARPDPVTREARKRLDDAVAELADRGAEAVVLGCTELPLAFAAGDPCPIPTVDATVALARALVRRAAPDRLAPLR